MGGLLVVFATFHVSMSASCATGFVETTSVEAYDKGGKDLSLDSMDCLPATTQCLPVGATVSCEDNIFYCRPSVLDHHDFFFIRPPRKCTFADGSRVCVVPGSCLMAYVIVSPAMYSFERIKWVPLTVVLSILFSLGIGYLYLRYSDDDLS